MWESTRSEAALQHHLLSCCEHFTTRCAVFKCSQPGSTLSAGTALPLANKNTALLWLNRKRARNILAGPSRCPTSMAVAASPTSLGCTFHRLSPTAAVTLHEQ